MKQINAAEFEAEVLQSPTPVLVDFFTPSCPPCVSIQRFLSEIEQERTSTLKMVKIDASAETRLATSFRVAGVPTLLLFSKGQVVAQIVGMRLKKELDRWIDESLAGK